MKRILCVSLGVALVISAGCSKKTINPAPATKPDNTLRSRIVMTDVTSAAHISFTHHNGGTGRRYYIETMSGGAAFLDYNGDGWQDIFLPQGAALPGDKVSQPLHSVLYRNDRNGTFTDVTKGSGLDINAYAMAPAVGDYDNDGRADLYLTTLDGNHLFHNEGNGKFRDVTAKAGVAAQAMSTGAAWLDYDNDGRLDLFVCRYTDYSVKKDKFCEDPEGRSVYCLPLIYTNTSSRLFRNKGNGVFEDVTQRSGIGQSAGRSLGVVCADLNADGRTDIYVANDMDLNFLFLNNGNGTLRDAASQAGVASGLTSERYAGMGTDCGDYMNEGRMGLAVTNFDHQPISLYRNLGAGTFKFDSQLLGVGPESYSYLKWGVRFVDLDMDGWQDLFVVNGHVQDRADELKDTAGYAQPCQIFRNHRGFRDVSTQCGSFFSRRLVGRGAAFGDYDNDGDTDVLVACNNQPAVLLRNDTPHTSNWVRIVLVGSGCNRNALGARIQVAAGALKQTQYLRSGGSYLSDHDQRLLFGIGKEKSASVEVRWPCGAVQKLEVQPNKTTMIKESGCKLNKHGKKNV